MLWSLTQDLTNIPFANIQELDIKNKNIQKEYEQNSNSISIYHPFFSKCCTEYKLQ